MKTRRHHNNKGHRQIKNGSTRKRAERLARELGVKDCPNKDKMGVYACSDRSECWEPCGDLGKDEEHVKISDVRLLPKIEW